MPAIVEFPTVVNEAVDVFDHHFANEPERKHFAEYLTGLFIAQNKNVSEINRQFAHTTDQSCLNRWVTEADWDVQELNQQRLDWLQEEPSTRYSAHGVIAIAAKLGSDIASASICADDSEEIAGAVSKLVQDLVRNKRI